MKSKEYFITSKYHERFTRVMNDDMIDRLYNDIDDFVVQSIEDKLDWERRDATIRAMQGLLASGKDDSSDVVELAIDMANVLIDAISKGKDAVV